VTSDEQAIRALVAKWHSATAAGDVDIVLGLMAQDVVFLVAGQAPMKGRGAFEKGLRDLLVTHRIESSGVVQEVEVSGGLAYCWNELSVRMTPLSGGKPVLRSGSTLSILRKEPSGAWVMLRDANLLKIAT
jgi:uncharacterized protein (TIGR02246 family)